MVFSENIVFEEEDRLSKDAELHTDSSSGKPLFEFTTQKRLFNGLLSFFWLYTGVCLWEIWCLEYFLVNYLLARNHKSNIFKVMYLQIFLIYAVFVGKKLHKSEGEDNMRRFAQFGTN